MQAVAAADLADIGMAAAIDGLRQAVDLSGRPPCRPTFSVDCRTGCRSLPAENVASLGRSLFTDYLLPVELAGTLLLVATIGAIAIASRRTEGLR